MQSKPIELGMIWLRDDFAEQINRVREDLADGGILQSKPIELGMIWLREEFAEQTNRVREDLAEGGFCRANQWS